MKRIPPSVDLDAPPAPENQNVIPFRIISTSVRRSNVAMSDKLENLFNQLTSRQRNLIMAAAKNEKYTPHSVIRQIAELETAISAVADLWAEEEGSRK
ncbi:hypothetical protein Q8W71_32535 [Methylobacterium sp. NEAU 140]|uniref:hypothetical protein n=1 Tax=Methylobacterium sp. NEAU 140 TaxID=3064945 RepID=UPI0027371CAB|nr:hypothetical protein [Methylobacterium sp. NEAU 140]MDP4027292.1 hypothetical protein [Methylobacterium sp. NEAU 140]